MDTTLEQLVWQRARSRCEYCQLPQSVSPLTHAIDHIIARKHHGPTQADNLALSCFFCNSFKGPNISGVDPQTGRPLKEFMDRNFLNSLSPNSAPAPGNNSPAPASPDNSAPQTKRNDAHP